jgi:hypothetical protein
VPEVTCCSFFWTKAGVAAETVAFTSTKQTMMNAIAAMKPRILFIVLFMDPSCYSGQSTNLKQVHHYYNRQLGHLSSIDLTHSAPFSQKVQLHRYSICLGYEFTKAIGL